MTAWRLIWNELLHRKANAALATLAVAVAVGVLVADIVLLRIHDAQTEAILKRRQQETDQRLAGAEDDYRRLMKELGFNLLILPSKQDLAEFWEKGYATHTMPEEHVRKLADSGTQTMRHLLPVVQQKVLWPEQRRRIILIGTRGEVPIRHRAQKEPMLLAVPVDKAVLGYQLARDLDLNAGDAITLLGREFTVDSARAERGTAEDATIWVDLKAAQELLDMEGRINGIEALKCFCAGAGLDKLRQEVARVLPDTKVVVRENKVTIRAKARAAIKAEHEAAMAQEMANRAHLREARESFAAVLVPMVMLGSALWIGLLALANVRDRTAEIGILRALGVRSGQISFVFLAKAGMVGLVGGLLGYALGIAAGVAAARTSGNTATIGLSAGLLAPALLLAVIPAAAILAAAVSWVPAIIAGRQDPAVVLGRE